MGERLTGSRASVSQSVFGVVSQSVARGVEQVRKVPGT